MLHNRSTAQMFQELSNLLLTPILLYRKSQIVQYLRHFSAPTTEACFCNNDGLSGSLLQSRVSLNICLNSSESKSYTYAHLVEGLYDKELKGWSAMKGWLHFKDFRTRQRTYNAEYPQLPSQMTLATWVEIAPYAWSSKGYLIGVR